jgi:hypothetical protein
MSQSQGAPKHVAIERERRREEEEEESHPG